MKSTKSLECGTVEIHNFRGPYFVTPHMALEGKTPAEKCGIEIKGNDKWVTLIQNATKSEL